MDSFRRVVTAISSAGKAVIASDSEVEDTLTVGGFIVADCWATNKHLQIGHGCTSRAELRMPAMPLPGDTALRYVVVPPDDVLQSGVQTNADPGREKEGAGMHATDTVDCGFVLKGELGLQLDDGQITWLQDGDCFIQQGTRHAWRNRSGVPAVIGVVMLGAARRD